MKILQHEAREKKFKPKQFSVTFGRAFLVKTGEAMPHSYFHPVGQALFDNTYLTKIP
jgi:hypothetical protein